MGDDFLTVSVVKPSQSNNAGITIYYRANLRLLQNLLTPEESKVCNADFVNFKSEGIHGFGIAKHVVEPDDSLEFLRIVNENINASKSFNNKNDKFLLKLAKDLCFIGVFGL